jgi:hypothetical protein
LRAGGVVEVETGALALVVSKGMCVAPAASEARRAAR